MIINIIHKKKLLSIILRAKFKGKGIQYFTPNELSLQLGYIQRDRDYTIEPHMHNLIKREINYTREVLIIRSGKVRIDFYDRKKNYLESRILNKGDIILIACGGHGLKILEPSEIIEIKQGPYLDEDQDRTRFESVRSNLIKIKN
jgi:hypothetical protein